MNSDEFKFYMVDSYMHSCRLAEFSLNFIKNEFDIKLDKLQNSNSKLNKDLLNEKSRYEELNSYTTKLKTLCDNLYRTSINISDFLNQGVESCE